MKHVSTGFLLLLLGSQPIGSQTIPSADLLKDFEIVREAYESLHPGLYRYNTPGQMRGHWSELERRLGRDLSIREAYLTFAEILARIRCGHTYANFWNQTEAIAEEVLSGSDKVPFTFRVLGRQLVIEESAVDDARVGKGTVISKIDGLAVDTILDRLIRFMHADGSADHQRLFELGVTGIGDYEPFDVYFPLVFPPAGNSYDFEAVDGATGKLFHFSAASMSREARASHLAQRYGPRPIDPDDLWEFELLDERTAYLKAGSFITWKMTLDWRAFLTDAFAILEEQQISNLIVDVRGNGGGDNDVLDALLGYLIPGKAEIPAYRQLVRYERVPERLEPYLDTWDPTFKDLTGKVHAVENGFFAANDESAEPRILEGSERAFEGRVFLLTDPSNSSATFQLARILKDAGAATLVGLPTGGNMRGINGGQIFFLRLPNSGIEMDIPLIGYFPLDEQPDRGVLPDVLVEPTAADIASDRDAALEAALEIIAAESASKSRPGV